MAHRAPSDIYRVLDANLNRAREGLRVLEDTARFVWRAPRLFTQLRNLRHALDAAGRGAYSKLVAARDSVSDEGRAMKEPIRRPAAALVIANFKRVEEAVRVLEEYGKVLSPAAVRRFKSVRYGAYDVEKHAAQFFLKPSSRARIRARPGTQK